uniref:Peptidase S1 domain-containing protein n=2 Tax=Anopheles arabiensis TaxID=7173 RepID=A0A182I755_ANOAR
CEQRFPNNKYVLKPTPAAYGGLRAFAGEFQHMAAIGWTRTYYNAYPTIDYLCGGSLITWKFVLTAAHCSADGNNIRPDTVRLGDTNLASFYDDKYAQQIPIARFIKHPQYRCSRKYYDIAVVELGQSVMTNTAICVACLWREQDAPGGLMDAVGFGATEFAGSRSSTLQKVKLQTLNKTICAKRLPAMRSEMPEGLRDDQLCAHSATMDMCEGDSGGPLQTDLHDLFGNIFPMVVGVVSFGTPCTDGSTGVYTRVSSYLDWIEQEVHQSFSYQACAAVNCYNRKLNPSMFGKVDKVWERSRVGLLWQEYETDIHQCGGLLVDYQFVITSASCVTSSKGPPRYVALSSDSDRAAIESVTVHPWFTKGHPYFDIAVIKLRVYANLDKIYPACIWSEEQHGDWRNDSILVGASYLEEHNDLYTRKSVQYYVGGERCRVGENVDYNDLSCISKDATLLPGICKIDHGGPVMKKFDGKQYIVHGIVSSLTQGCEGKVIFTSLTPHREWLEEIMYKQQQDMLWM